MTPKDKSIKSLIISQVDVAEIRNSLQIILGEAQLTMSTEEKLSERGQNKQKIICRTVSRIENLLPGEKNGSTR